MSGNTIGRLFTLTSFGESHGPAIGGIVDGCPPGLALSEADLQPDLDRRKPGQSRYTTQRREEDAVRILSGVFEGRTTGAPIALLIENTDQRSKDYSNIKDTFRPNHADYVYTQKYGFRDYRGGGRSSARETAVRVAAGAIAKKYLREQAGILVRGYLAALGSHEIASIDWEQVEQNSFFCPDAALVPKLEEYMQALIKSGDSIGARINVVATGVPVGLGEPVFDRLDADLAHALMGINAVKGVEIGAGFAAVAHKGSEHRDEMTPQGFLANNAGGILGGISTGQDILASIALKPTSSIRLPARSIDRDGNPVEVATHGRHDPCVGIRATPIAEAMVALVLIDHFLRNRAQNLDVVRGTPVLPPARMNAAPQGGAYWRLSSFYFVYFACLGVLMPYWSLYLEAAGLGAAQIGAVLAAMAATRIVGPNFWGWLADRSGRRVAIIRTGSVLAAFSFVALVPGITPGWLLIVVVLHTFFWNAILALYEAITLDTLGSHVHRYGQVRLWGSVSFVLAVMVAGLVFDRIDVVYLPWVMLLPLALLALGSFAIRAPLATPREREGRGLGVLLRSRVLWAFLAGAFLMQASHAPYYGFFSLLLDRHGYTRIEIGWFWGFSVLAEVVLFAISHRLLARFSLRGILLVSLLLATARWSMIAAGAQFAPVLLLAQCLHAASFGSFHAAGVEMVRRHFGPHHMGQGQALYSAVSFGAGGAIGSLASGALWEVDMHLAFVFAALASLGGWWVVRAEVRGALFEHTDGAQLPVAEPQG